MITIYFTFSTWRNPRGRQRRVQQIWSSEEYRDSASDIGRRCARCWQSKHTFLYCAIVDQVRIVSWFCFICFSFEKLRYLLSSRRDLSVKRRSRRSPDANSLIASSLHPTTIRTNIIEDNSKNIDRESARERTSKSSELNCRCLSNEPIYLVHHSSSFEFYEA